MATPHVAGVAALALAVDPSLTVSQLRTLLTGTATAFAADASPQGCPTVRCGAGIVNAAGVVAAVPKPTPTHPDPTPTPTPTPHPRQPRPPRPRRRPPRPPPPPPPPTPIPPPHRRLHRPGRRDHRDRDRRVELHGRLDRWCLARAHGGRSVPRHGRGRRELGRGLCIGRVPQDGRRARRGRVGADRERRDRRALPALPRDGHRLRRRVGHRTSGRLFVFRPGAVRVNAGAAATRSRSVSLVDHRADRRRLDADRQQQRRARHRGQPQPRRQRLVDAHERRRLQARLRPLRWRITRRGGHLSDAIVLDTRAPTVAVSTPEGDGALSGRDSNRADQPDRLGHRDPAHRLPAQHEHGVSRDDEGLVEPAVECARRPRPSTCASATRPATGPAGSRSTRRGRGSGRDPLARCGRGP